MPNGIICRYGGLALAPLSPALLDNPRTRRGRALHLTSHADLAVWVWSGAALVITAHVGFEVLRSLMGGQLGVDVIALAAILAAVVLGEALTASVIGLMVAGGEALEAWAEGHAKRALHDLMARAPRRASRITPAGVEDIDVATIQPGDSLLVRPGETVAADGVLEDMGATLNEAALTGEPLPASITAGAPLRSGAVNAGAAFRMRAEYDAEASTYAAIIRLTRAASETRPPLARLADRWALGFLALTAVVAGGAWLWSGDPIRALAVLVVATPCPLILAAPIALIAGIGRAARLGVVVKGGGALERLARISTVMFDKTGTLTPGRPRLAAIDVTGRHWARWRAPIGGNNRARLDPSGLLRPRDCGEPARRGANVARHGRGSPRWRPVWND